ncbi:hypothetical protein OROHE_009591 [Orobanche hederae]
MKISLQIIHGNDGVNTIMQDHAGYVFLHFPCYFHEQHHPQIHHELDMDMDGRPIYIKLISNEVGRRVWNKL